MQTTYLRLACLALACTMLAQASTSIPIEAKTSQIDAVIPSFKQDILGHRIAWILSPCVMSLLQVLGQVIVDWVQKNWVTHQTVNKKPQKIIQISIFLLAYLLAMVIALLVASWRSLWKIKGSHHAAPPFKDRFWRAFRFVSCTMCCSMLFGGLAEYTSGHFHQNIWMSYFLYPCALALVIALGLGIYDHVTNPREAQTAVRQTEVPSMGPSQDA